MDPLQQLIEGSSSQLVAVRAGKVIKRAPPGVLFPGAFRPLHQGHSEMARLAVRRTKMEVDFEISLQNVDKQEVTANDLAERLRQFRRTDVVWVTRLATFEQKSQHFPGAKFVVGADTIARIADPVYYAGDPSRRDRSIRTLVDRGVRFLVFGRLVGGGFVELEQLPLPQTLVDICESVSQEDFRIDLSSTELRRRFPPK